MRLQPLKILSEQEIRSIHEASCDILEACGVATGSRRMLEFLKKKGLPVDEEKQVVRFPRSVIEDAIAMCPAKFDVYDREGKLAFTLGDGNPAPAAGHNAVFWLDWDTGKVRASTVEDVEIFASICEQLPNIKMVGVPVMPQNVPDARLSLLYGVKACIENTRKPIFFSTDNPNIHTAVISMLSEAFAGNIKERVYGIGQISPTSPLSWEKGALEAIMDSAGTGVPITILPEPNTGVSCPYTLAGLLVMNNAECLSGIAMIQLLAPGSKVIYGTSWTTTDMRNGAALVGSAETSACRIAGVQIARFYRIPCHTTAPNSDNHAHDEQNGWEKMLSMFCAVGAGADLIVNCGMFATGLTCSHEQLVMDDEISGMALRVFSGIEIGPETIAAGVIKRVGPGGLYLQEEHTLQRLHAGEFYRTTVSTNGPFSIWESAGCRDAAVLARERARNLSRQKTASLDTKRRARLAEIIQNFVL